MSLYVEWVNKIKAQATSEWLTENQRLVFEPVVKKWRRHPFVCVHGAAGCGKSFIARLLSDEQGYEYVQDLVNAPPNSARVVLDDAEYSRTLRTVAADLGLGRVVLMMRKPPKEDMPKVELRLTDKDVDTFLALLYKHNITGYIHREHKTTNLDQILQAEALARVEA